MTKSSQLEFLDKNFKRPGDIFGGSLLKSHPKVKRPLVTRFPIHVVLRANFSKLRLPKTYAKVNQLVYKTAKKYGIKIYKYANVGNHLHLLIKLSKLDLWRGFIRELSSKIASLVDKATRQRISRKDTELYQVKSPQGDHKDRGFKTLNKRSDRKSALQKTDQQRESQVFRTQDLSKKIKPQVKFWKHRPFTRIVRSWNKAFTTIKSYIDLNEWEAQGHISRRDIKTLKDLRALFESG